jgi:hypothetical protein
MQFEILVPTTAVAGRACGKVVPMERDVRAADEELRILNG